MREIQRISITDAVVATIKEAVETGEYARGQKLPTEAVLCSEMKVSRTSVREALRVLQALGYVTIKPGKGAFVSETAAETQTIKPWYGTEGVQYSDFMEVRLVLETLAVRLAVERATSKQVRELEEVHSSFCEACENHDLTKLIMLDETFHLKIMACTGNSLLVNMNRQLLKAYRVYRSESFVNEKLYDRAVEPHGRILDCFRSGDANQAVAEMERHMRITRQDMVELHRLPSEK